MVASDSSSVTLGTLRNVDAHLLEQVFNHAPDIVFFIKDAWGRYVAINDSLLRRSGLKSRRQIIGKTVRTVIPCNLGQASAEQDLSVLRTGKPIIDHMEMHWAMPNKPCWCLTTKLPLLGQEGRIIGLIGISRDLRAPIDLSDIPEGLSLVLDVIEKNYGQPLRPASLAKRAGISPVRLARLIKRIFNLTPSQLITQTRLAAASSLLLDSQRSVADIALETGFCDHSAFSRVFRSATGLTPTEFRERTGWSHRPQL